MENTKKIIIDDVVYIEKDDNGYPMNGIKNTFFYKFLSLKISSFSDNEKAKKELKRLMAYNEIYLFIYKQGFLDDKRFCLKKREEKNAIIFTFDLSKAIEQTNLAEAIIHNFYGKDYDEYLNRLFYPADCEFCSVCGALTLSRNPQYEYKNQLYSFCYGCSDLNATEKNGVHQTLVDDGTLEAIKTRLIVEERNNQVVADNLTTEKVFDDYVNLMNNKNQNFTLKFVKSIFEKANLDQYTIFWDEYNGLTIIDKAKFCFEENFKESVVLNDEHTEINYIFDKPNIVYTGIHAKLLTKSFCDNKEDLELLKSLKFN